MFGLKMSTHLAVDLHPDLIIESNNRFAGIQIILHQEYWSSVLLQT